MGKHAYLILAHNNWSILNKQLSLIDNDDNDIYIVIDKKSKSFNPESLYKCAHSELHILESIDVYWADYSAVSAYLNLISAAFVEEKETNKQYTYFHLQSGACLPIKTQRYIHDFCDNSGKEFIGIVPQEFSYCTNRIRVYWPFINTNIFRKHKPFKALCYSLAFLQKILGVNRLKNCDYSIYNGWCNCSISHQFATHLLDFKDMIFKMFHKTLAPDELWVHTLAYNSEFRERLYDVSDLRMGSMRYIDWERGRPYTWGGAVNDLALLLNSPYLFARKFDENVNMEIVEKLCAIIKSQEVE